MDSMKSVPDPAVRLPPSDVKPVTAIRARGLGVINTVSAHQRAVSCVALHPDSDRFVTVSDDGHLKQWSLPAYVNFRWNKCQIV